MRLYQQATATMSFSALLTSHVVASEVDPAHAITRTIISTVPTTETQIITSVTSVTELRPTVTVTVHPPPVTVTETRTVDPPRV